MKPQILQIETNNVFAVNGERLRRKTMKRLMSTAVVSMMVGAAVLGRAQTNAAAVAAKTAKGGLQLNGGLDFRLRDEMKHELPSTGVAEAKKFENMWRLRSRMWGSAGYEDYTLFGRVANEFRVYTARSGKNRVPFASSKPGSATYAFPDELYIDNLYFDAKNLFGDWLDLRIGRQDMKFGDGRIISDGSAADGARAAYFDAVRATLHVTEKSTLDAFAVYMNDYDDWGALGPYDRPLASIGATRTDNEETGLGLYYTSKDSKAFPFELYWIWKDETYSHDISGKKYGRDFHTVGTRLLPKFSSTVSAEIELAVQTGETDDGRDILGFMGYAGLPWVVLPDHSSKLTLTPAVLYLSGDDKASQSQTAGDDTNWNAVFNRTTWFSVLLADQYTNYRWANLIYPQIQLSAALTPKQKIRLHTGPVFAEEDDQSANGTDDTYKGYLTFVRYEGALVKGFLTKKSDINHAVQLEVFEPGDYYDFDRTAVFLRWELNAKF
jgi:hypothetical protein